MSEVVMIHGIGQEQHQPEELAASWADHLATGLRAAGYPDEAGGLAERARLTYYADVFGRPDQQGAPAVTGQEELVAELLADVLRNAVDRGPEPDRREAERALAVAGGTLVDQQGPRAALRPLLRAAARMRMVSHLGFAAAERHWAALGQVARYFTDEDVRERVLKRVLAQLGPETKVVVAHSLGTAVAYEALHRLEHPLPLLLTLGSPLGLRTVVYDRLRPAPPHVPPLLRRWVNVLDPDDLIAARPDLTSLFPGADGVLEPHRLVDNGRKPHAAGAYLTKPESAGPVGEILRGYR